MTASIASHTNPPSEKAQDTTPGPCLSYEDFLNSKKFILENSGKIVPRDLIHAKLFDFQKDIVMWSVKKGRCAVFIDTGLGKTFIQLEWARLIGEKTLIVAPLSVARQTIREAKKIDIEIKYVRSQSETTDGLNITNYEMLDNFEQESFGAIVLDESSILKSIGGKIKQKLVENFSKIPYKLCCTATPAPNDFVELGNHASFLGICSQQEMLAMFFINANKEHTFVYDDIIVTKKGSNANGTEWRLKHHAEGAFFEWLAKWSIMMTKPSDLEYDDDGFVLPELTITPIFISHDYQPNGELFFSKLHGIEDRVCVRRESAKHKIDTVKEIINNANGQCIAWCGLDDEADLLYNNIENCMNVKGSDKPENKVKAFEDFQDGIFKVLITKPKIGAYGMNFQNANTMIFFGLNDSWETYYQAIRREWRFGQTRPVNVYLVLSEYERAILDNIQRKENQALRLRRNMIAKLKNLEIAELHNEEYNIESYETATTTGTNWTAMRGDSCERLKEIPDDSIDLSIYSPPFADLFVYSNSDRDLGNCRNWDEFFKHYSFIIKEVLRVTKQGRLSCVHTSDIPAMANRDGYIGLRDFPGEVLRAHQREGWVFVGRAFIQKNPQAQVHNGEMDNERWIQWAHGIWTDIKETDTLQFYCGRDKDDEKHICPLQLGTIERCIKLYSNPNETILTPFMGIGSESFMAVKLGRKTVGIELKESYYKIAVQNLQSIQLQELF